MDGNAVELSLEDVPHRAGAAGRQCSETSGDYAVILDTALTQELVAEGYVRELVSKVQTMRKEAATTLPTR